jgi:hypothetical protein
MPTFRFYDIEVMDEALTVALAEPAKNACHLWLALPAGLGLTPGRVGPLTADLRARGLAVDGADGALHPTAEFAAEIARRIRQSNPALPVDARLAVHDLHTPVGTAQLALRLGLYSGKDITDLSKTDPTLDTFVSLVANSYPQPMPTEVEDQPLRLLTDLDPRFDEGTHPYIAGYNSLSYDLVVLALMFSQALWPTGQAGERASFTPVDPGLLRAFSNQVIAFDGYAPRLLRPSDPGRPGVDVGDYFTDGRGVDDYGKAATVYDQWVRSGRHLDVARLNEVQAYVGLKRMLSQMGRQVTEHGGLAEGVLPTADDLIELCAYNVADALGLAHVMDHPLYAGALELRRSLIGEYPSTVRDKLSRVRSFQTGSGQRATVNSTSAQLVENILAPSKPVTDFVGVSYLYPRDGIEVTHPATECGQPGCLCAGRDELENAWRWFDSSLDNSLASASARRQVKEVFDFYRNIRGRNFNDGRAWSDVYRADPAAPQRVSDLASLPKARMTVPYFRADGEATDCFINFSIGGSHGAQYDSGALDARNAKATAFNADLAAAMSAFPGPGGPIEFFTAHGPSKPFVGPSGRSYQRQHLLTPASTRKAMSATLTAGLMEPDGRSSKAAPVQVGWREAKPLAGPFIEQTVHGQCDDRASRPVATLVNRLDPKLGFTSVGLVLHEDFSSYYPNLLAKLRVFDSGTGSDPYMDIYRRKEDLGALVKDPSTSPQDKVRASVLRGGAKLVLNSASGAADMARDTKLRANNAVLSMRILGQIEIWRVAQSQAFAGAQVVSTNTDGLYVVLDPAGDPRRVDFEAIVAAESARIGIAIEPEPMWLVSKDSNNRLEVADDSGAPGRMLGASGGSLAAFQGPTPAKSAANPGLVDQLLAEAMAHYLRSHLPSRPDHLMDFDEPLDESWLAARLDELFSAARPDDLAHLVRQCARVIVAGSAGTNLYPYAVDAASVADAMDETDGAAELLGKYSRVFLVREGTPGAKRVATASLRLIPTKTAAEREAQGLRAGRHHPRALTVLQAAGVEILDSFEAAARLTTRLDSTQPVLVDERDLVFLAHTDPRLLRSTLVDHLDREAYADHVRAVWDLWRNTPRTASQAVDPSPPVVMSSDLLADLVEQMALF